MKVFLTGATGYIGAAIAETLIAHGHNVTGLARSDVAAGYLARRGIAIRTGSLQSTDALITATRDADAVIHAAATNDEDMPVTDLDAVCAMLDALRGTAKRFIYTSTLWVYGDTGTRVIDPTTPLWPTHHVWWRPVIEEQVRAAALDGVHSAVVRPGIVYGRGGGLLAAFAASARATGAARYVGHGENYWPVVHVDALADLYVRILERAPAGRAWIGAHGPSYRVRDLAAAASDGAGAGGATTAWPVATAHRDIGWLAEALTLDQHADSTLELQLLGWNPTAPNVLDDLRGGSYTGPRRAGGPSALLG